MDEIESKITSLELKIDEIEHLLDKDFEEWTTGNKNKYGNHEQLRKEKEQLRDKEKQLREQLIIQEKQKLHGISLFLTAMDFHFTQKVLSNQTKSEPDFIRIKNYNNQGIGSLLI